MALKKKYGTDSSKIASGVPYVVDEYERDGQKVKATIDLSFMSAASNKKFEAEVNRLSKPYRRQLVNGSIDAETNRRITVTAFVNTIVKGWNNVVFEEGSEPLPFTKENATMLLTELPELYDELLQFAGDRTNFGVVDSDPVADEAAAKNSPSGSSSSSNFPTTPTAKKA